MKKWYRGLLVALAFVMLLSLTALTACGEDEKEGSAAIVVASEDGKYDLHMNSLGKAWITGHDKTEQLVTGSCKVREENSAFMLTLEEDVQSVGNNRLTYTLEYENAGDGVAKISFVIHRGELMKGLGMTGVVVDTAYDDPDNPDPNAGGGGMGGTSLLLSAIGSGTQPDTGKLEIKILKIQGNWDYTYTKEDGFKLCPTETQLKTLGTGEVSGPADGVYTITYDLKVNLPPFASPKGSATLRVADIESGLLLA